MNYKSTIIGLLTLATLGTVYLPLSSNAQIIRDRRDGTNSSNSIKQVFVTVENAVVKGATDSVAGGRFNPVNAFAPGKKPDCYVTVSINNEPAQRSRTIDDQSEPTFNFTVSAKVAATATAVPITINLFDADGRIRGGDDRIDINPVSGNRALTLVYNPQTGKVSAPVNVQRSKGLSFPVQGSGDGNPSGLIHLLVNHGS